MILCLNSVGQVIPECIPSLVAFYSINRFRLCSTIAHRIKFLKCILKLMNLLLKI
ncbi:MAG: hypothetical protein GKC53_01470 [Neisseriaceae bacterium]|nr:MAG: hypothetical protein GKC53_01470 [Neisseriaceae bacterium]